MTEVRLSEFQLKHIKPNAKVLIISKMLYSTVKCVISAMTNGFEKQITPLIFNGGHENELKYGGTIPPFMIYNDYDDDVMERFRLLQTNFVKQNHANKSIIVFDECITSHNFWKNNNIRWLMQNNDYYDTSVIVRIQYPVQIPPNMRVCFDYVLIDPGYKNNFRNLRTCQQEHFAMCSLDIFMKLYQQTAYDNFPNHETQQSKESRTTSYDCLHNIIGHDVANLISERYLPRSYFSHTGLMINNTITYNILNPFESIYWYHIERTKPDKKIGREALWKFANDNIKPKNL